MFELIALSASETPPTINEVGDGSHNKRRSIARFAARSASKGILLLALRAPIRRGFFQDLIPGHSHLF